MARKKIPTCCGHHILHSPSTPLSQVGLRSPLPFQYRQRKSAGGEVEKLLRCHLNSRDRVIFSEAGSVRPPILDLGGKSQQLGYKTSRRQRACLPSRQLRLSAVRLFKRFFKDLLGKTPSNLFFQTGGKQRQWKRRSVLDMRQKWPSITRLLA